MGKWSRLTRLISNEPNSDKEGRSRVRKGFKSKADTNSNPVPIEWDGAFYMEIIAVLKFIDEVSLLRLVRIGHLDLAALSEKVLSSPHQ